MNLQFYITHLPFTREPSLVLDLIEEFRQQVVDRALIGLFSKRVIKPEEVLAAGVKAEEGRIQSRKTVQSPLDALPARLDNSIMFDDRGPLKSFIYSQACNITRF